MTMKTRVNTHKNNNLPPHLLHHKTRTQIKLQRKVAKRSQNSKKSRKRDEAYQLYSKEKVHNRQRVSKSSNNILVKKRKQDRVSLHLPIRYPQCFLILC